MAVKKAGKRGPGKRVTDAELAAVISDLGKAHPDLSRAQMLEVAYWVNGLALTRARWDAAWSAATAG